jgi:capsular exopolysaccharide synthesis family protein
VEHLLLPGKPVRKNLLEGFSPDAPYVTETRRLLQNLYRERKDSSAETRSYMVTSAGREEGKSTICAMMSIVSARIFDRRTILVDGDLRRPTAHHLVGVSQGPGLFDIFKRGASLEEATHSTTLPRLSVIPSGHVRGPSSDSYSDEGFEELLRRLRSKYDAIFVDAAPAVPVIEPLLMAEHVDAILVIAMAGRTPVTMARRSMQILSPVADKIVGVVLNNAAEGLPYYYDYRYYGYKRNEPSRIRQSAALRRSKEDAGERRNDTPGGS